MNTGLGPPSSPSFHPPINALAIDPTTPSTLYAGTSGGVFKSTNGGGSWSPMNTGLDPSPPLFLVPFINALAIDPTSPGTVYAGTWGVFTSANGGSSWNATSVGLPNGYVGGLIPILSLAIDSTSPRTLYAGTYGAGVFKGTGGVWSQTSSGLGPLIITALVIDPTTPSTLYAGTSASGVFKSSNGGESWSAMNPGPTTPFINALVVDRSTPATVYAGTAAGVFAFIPGTTPPYTSARCILEALLQSPECTGQAVPATVTEDLDKAANLSDKARRSSGKTAPMLLKQATKDLNQAKATAARAAKGKKPKISRACAGRLKTISGVRGHCGGSLASTATCLPPLVCKPNRNPKTGGRCRSQA